MGRLPVLAPPIVALGLVGAAASGREPAYSTDASAASITRDLDGDGFGDALFSLAGDPGRVALHRGTRRGISKNAAWTLQGAAGEGFGYGIAAADDVDGDGFGEVVVGAPEAEDGAGRVYVYSSRKGRAPALRWTLTGTEADEHFGAAVAGAGDVNGDGFGDILVRSIGDKRRGKVSLFLGGRTGLSSKHAWSRSGTADDELFGRALAAADVNHDGMNDVLVGSPAATDRRLREGMAFLFHGHAGGLENDFGWAATGGTSGAWFGGALAVGDLDGDGELDIAIGAEKFSQRGQVSLFRGRAGALPDHPDWIIEGEPWEQIGSAVALADVDADGKADLLAGARAPEGGRLVWYRGNAAFRPKRVDLSIEPSASPERLFADSISTGDVNRDGKADVAVRAHAKTSAVSSRAHLFLGRALRGGLEAGRPPPASASTARNPTTVWSVDREGWHTGFGAALAAGDVDGDGLEDLIVGETPENGKGRAYVFPGIRGGLSATPSWHIEGESEYAYLGFAVAFLGDVNGDGFGDVAIGADRTGSSSAGMASVFHGSRRGLSRTADWTARGTAQPYVHGLGEVVAAGDMNGDGLSDLVVGARACDKGPACSRLYLGNKTGLGKTPAWEAPGRALAAGDANGDGRRDLLVLHRARPGNQYEHSLAIHFGGAGGLEAQPSWQSSIVSEYNLEARLADVDRDGIDDVIVAATQPRRERWRGEHNGIVSCFLGTKRGPEALPKWRSIEVAGGLGESLHVADLDADGNVEVLAGSRWFTNGERHEGAVFVFTIVPETGISTPWVIESNTSGGDFGGGLTSMRDFDGDGAREIAVGAPYLWTDFPNRSGRVQIYRDERSPRRRSRTDLRVASAPLFVEARASEYRPSTFSRRIVATDVNGDGVADLLRGVEGAVWIQLGTRDGFAAAARLTDGSEGDHVEVAEAGDFNGDGLPDVIVGFPDADEEQAGEVILFSWSRDDGTFKRVSSYRGKPGQLIGCALASAGDVDGDGFDDILVGTPDCVSGGKSRDLLLLFRGNRAGTFEPSWTYDVTISESSELAASILGGVDLNQDGFSDFLVGAPTASVRGANSGVNVGRVHLFMGSRDGPVPMAWGPYGKEPGERFGSALGVGDVTGDGILDVVIGAPDKSGRIDLYRGLTVGFEDRPIATIEAVESSWVELGRSIALTDVDQDGHADLITTRPGEWAPGAKLQVGRLDVYRGHEAGLEPFPSWSVSGTADEAIGGSLLLVDVDRDGALDIVVGPPWRTFLSAKGRMTP